MHILVVSDAFDTVLRMSFCRLAEKYEVKIYVIGPSVNTSEGSPSLKFIPGSPITSKFSGAAIKEIRAAVKAYNIDVVFAPSTSGLSNALFATIGTKAKVVGYRGTQHKIRRTDPTHYLALLNPRLSHVVCETADIHEYLQNFISPTKLSGMPKPYQVEWVSGAMANPKTVDFAQSALRCIYVGNSKNRPFKGLGYLLDAMAILEPEGVTLTVIGTFDDEDKSRATANVKFLGSRADAVDFIPSHDLLILPSTRDASPRVVREAQACGIPCIVTDIPGARDLIIDGVTGLLVAPASVAAIVDAVRTLKSDIPAMRRMGNAGRRNIEDNFGMEDYVDYYYNLFSSLI